MPIRGNIQFNSEKLRQGYKPIFVVKFSTYDATGSKYYASRTITLDGKSYLMLCESLPTITRTLKYVGGLSSINSVNLTIINQGKESDFLRTTGLGYIMGTALIAIVFDDGTTPQWAERLEIFRGKIDDLTEISEDAIGFSIIDNSKLVNKIVGTLLSDNDYPLIPPDSIGKMKNIIYGDHSYAGMKSLNPAEVNFSYLNNMVKCLRISNNKYIIAESVLDSISDSDFWLYDKSVDRYLNVDSACVNISNPDANGDCTVILSETNVILYDWMLPIESGNKATNIRDWLHPEMAGDRDILSFAEYSGVFDYEHENQRCDLYITFPAYDMNGFTSAIYSLYYRGNYDLVGGDDRDVLYRAGDGGTMYSLKEYTDDSIVYIGDLPNYSADLIGQLWGLIHSSYEAYVSCRFREIFYKVKLTFPTLDADRFEFYAACKGKEYGSWIDYRSTDDDNPNTGLKYTISHPDSDNSEMMIANPIGVIESVCRDYLGLTDSELELDSFNRAASKRSTYKFSFVINKQITAIELLDKLAYECQCWLFWNYANRLEIIAYDTSANFTCSGTSNPNPDDIFIHQPEKFAIEFTVASDSSLIYFAHNDAHKITGDFTYETLIYFYNLDGDNAIVSYGGNDDSELEADNCLFEIYIDENSVIHYRHEFGAGEEETKTIVLNNSIYPLTWYRICILRDSAITKKIYVYIFNPITGALVAQGTSTAYTYNPTGGANGILKIGSKNNRTSFCDCLMMECRLWNDRRLLDELLEYSCKILVGNESNLVGNWRLDECGSDTITDISPTGANGICGGDLSGQSNSSFPVNGYYAQHPIVKDTFKITLLGTGDLVNDITINYFNNYESNKTQKTANVTDAISIAKYGQLAEVVNSEYIADTTTAENFLSLLLAKKYEKYYMVTFRTWLNAATKTEGDIINIRHPLLDNGIMTNANMATAKWQITSITHDLNNGEIEIQAVILSIP